MALVKCPYCGMRVDDRDGECFACGAPLLLPPFPPAVSQPPVVPAVSQPPVLHPLPQPSPIQQIPQPPAAPRLPQSQLPPSDAAVPKKHKYRAVWIIIGAAFMLFLLSGLLLSFCASIEDAEVAGTGEEELSYEEPQELFTPVSAPEVDEAAFSGEGSVQSFIGRPFYDGVIRDENDAMKAV